MRSTIRHVAVLAAAVVMLTAIAVPAHGKGDGYVPKPPDVFEVTCYYPHYVTAVAADKSGREQWLQIELAIPIPNPPYWLRIDYDQAKGTGLLEVEVAGSVLSKYRVAVLLDTKVGQTVTSYRDYVDGVC